MSIGQVGRSIELLKERGISDPSEFASLPDQTVLTILARFDADEGASVGALVFRLRQAVKKQADPQRSRRDVMAREAEYGREIAAWLERMMPDVCDARHGPHPAAVAAVIRLHHQHGRGLTKARHGAWIRTFIRDWEKRLLDSQDRWFTNQSKEKSA